MLKEDQWHNMREQRPKEESKKVDHSIGPGESAFPVEREYARCVTALDSADILTFLQKSASIGVVGIDGKEYPMPAREQVVELFAHNRELVDRKVPQGFDRLELTPMVMPMPLLIGQMKAAILKHAAEGTIYQTRRSPSDPLVPVRVNADKQVWIWETLRQALDTDELVYFPREYSSDHRRQTKLAAVNVYKNYTIDRSLSRRNGKNA